MTGQSKFSGLRVGLYATIAIVSVLAAQLVFAQNPPSLPWTPVDLGKSDQDIRARQQAGETVAEAKYRAWLDNFVASGQDPRSLERRPMDGGRAAPPKPNLATATLDAEAIISGVVEKADYSLGYYAKGFDGTIVTIRLDSVAKGALIQGQTMQVRMAGGPEPYQDYKDGYLAYAKEAPLLLPGDRAVLFLNRDTVGEYEPHAFTGVYNIVNGQVRALDGNPFKQVTEGLTEAAFMTLIGTAIR
jgi:hypothetical protein